MTTRMMDIQAGDKSGTFQGYLSLPASGSGPGLVIAQEIFGVNISMREVADYYAQEGYVVLVPDLFWRQEPGVQLGYTRRLATRLRFYQGFDEAKGVEDIQASLNALRAMAEVQGQPGVLGFCLGGKLAYLAACRTDASVSVSYYGVGIDKALNEASISKTSWCCILQKKTSSVRLKRKLPSPVHWQLIRRWRLMCISVLTMRLPATAATISTNRRL